METPPPPPPMSAGAVANAPRKPIHGLAVTSLVLGILGVVTSVVLVGAFMAVAGLVFGAIHLVARREGRGLAWAGVGVSALGLAATVGFAALYAFGFHRAMEGVQGAGDSSFTQWVGKPAPDFEVTAIDGSRCRLSEFRGRRVVLDFWATWCGPCVSEIPHFVRLRREVPESRLVVIGLSEEDRAVLKPFAESHQMNYPVVSVARSELPAPWSLVRAIPTTFFIDEAGVVRSAVVGYHEYDALERLALGTAEPSKESSDH